jgi:hypothetical protein
MLNGIRRRSFYVVTFGLAIGFVFYAYQNLASVQVKTQSEKAIQYCGEGNVKSVTKTMFTCI